MTRRPTKRKANQLLDNLEDDVGAGDDVDVTITTYGVDLAENVDDVNHDDGVVLSGGGACAVNGCDESALVDVNRCGYHYDGDSGGTDDK